MFKNEEEEIVFKNEPIDSDEDYKNSEAEDVLLDADADDDGEEDNNPTLR